MHQADDYVQMSGLRGGEMAMQDALDQGGDMMDTLDADMLPMSLDLNISPPARVSRDHLGAFQASSFWRLAAC